MASASMPNRSDIDQEFGNHGAAKTPQTECPSFRLVANSEESTSRNTSVAKWDREDCRS